MLTDKATFAAGCFWGIEAAFAALPGVLDTRVGYAGGTAPEPSYESVCGGDTGHAEAVEVTFRPDHVSFRELLETFFALHNPTQPYLKRTEAGAPHRSQYRSAIYTHSPEQATEALTLIAEIDASRRYPAPITTEVEPATVFWTAEEHHQRYFEKRNLPPPARRLFRNRAAAD